VLICQSQKGFKKNCHDTVKTSSNKDSGKYWHFWTYIPSFSSGAYWHVDRLSLISVSFQSRLSLVSVSSQSRLSLVSVSSQSRLSLVSLSSHSHLRLVSVSSQSQSHFSLVSVSPLSWLSLVSSFRLLRPPSLMLWLCKMPAFSFLSFVNNYVSHFC
jgi:hypothetical protein